MFRMGLCRMNFFRICLDGVGRMSTASAQKGRRLSCEQPPPYVFVAFFAML